jgi:Bacterial Ig domain
VLIQDATSQEGAPGAEETHMKTCTRTLLRFAAAVAFVAFAAPAGATLLDHGPADPVLVFPTWYRDLNGLALGECLSQTPSPNLGAAGKPMCFLLNPNPAGFPGNVGPEIFFNGLNVALGKGAAAASVTTFAMTYVAALEGSYLPAGLPVHGTEAVFARIRITANIQVAGTYKVTHPFGVELFNVRPADLGARAIFFTADVPVGTPLNFDASLNGRIGPFIQWDFVDPGITLAVKNAAGATETFVADPNLPHTYTGSPFGTNFVRVDGPVGSNLDGVGNDFMQTPLGNVIGMKYGAAIPTPLSIQRATYSRDPVNNLVSIDVYATSAPGSQMILTGVGMPSVAMKGDGSGSYFAHVEMAATVLPPASVTVTNATSNPVNSAVAALVDLVNVTSATFDTLTSTLKVTATTSDLSAPPPALTVAGPLGGPMTAGSYSAILAPTALPPAKVSVNSAAGGTDSESVAVLPGLPMNKPGAPVAVPDAVITNENTPLAFDVSANDSVVAPATLASVVVITPPTSGTAVPLGINSGIVTYTPNTGFFGTDSYQYILIDSAGQASNAATVTVTVNFVALGPTANPDDFAMVQNTSRTYNVTANDLASAATTINLGSIVITTPPLHGNAVANADGTVTYTPRTSYVGADSYQYTVANSAGVASNAATVSVVVEGGPESVSISKATFRVSTSKWTIVGSTNWFGPTLTHTRVTCWVAKGIAVGPVIGSAPVDTTGKFQLVPPTLTDPPPDATNIFTCQTSNGGSVSAVVQRI